MHTTEIDGAVFDMDGVLTSTARLHEAAWARVFDAELATRGDDRPFSHDDYRRYVDGRQRREGIWTFLAARGFSPDARCIDRLAETKNAAFLERLSAVGARPMPGARALLDIMRALNLRVGVFTASRNAEQVLASSGLAQRIDARVDGITAEAEGLAGKPQPDLPLTCAARLGVAPQRCALFEDSTVGIEAGRAGQFFPVVGVAPPQDQGRLRDAGAHHVVADLSVVVVKA